jgi:hypothetical protein
MLRVLRYLSQKKGERASVVAIMQYLAPFQRAMKSLFDAS